MHLGSSFDTRTFGCCLRRESCVESKTVDSWSRVELRFEQNLVVISEVGGPATNFEGLKREELVTLSVCFDQSQPREQQRAPAAHWHSTRRVTEFFVSERGVTMQQQQKNDSCVELVLVVCKSLDWNKRV